HATGPESARLVLAEAVIDANRHSVGAGGSCRNKMKVPHCSGQVWLGNESKQLCSHWADRNLVVQKWCIGQWVHQLHWQGRKIATPLGQRRHVGKPVKWIAAARPRVVAKNEGLGSTFVDVRNVERAPDGRAKTVLVVAGFVDRLPVQRKRLR